MSHSRKAKRDDALRSLREAAADERKAVEFVEARRWGDTPACPRCGDTDVYQMQAKDGGRNKDWRWRCRGCKRMHTVRTGTVMEESRLPLRYWIHAFWRAAASKKGVAALQIQRELGINYKTALYLLNRIRHAMSDDAPGLLGGDGQTVEVDETYVGGKPRHRGPHNVRGPSTKTPVVAAVERGGRVRFRVMERVTSKNLQRAVAEHVDAHSRLVTDDYGGYKRVGKMMKGGHEAVNHSRNEYVRVGTDIHSNTVESVFSLLKRGVYGTFHSVSTKHLPKYLHEFEFRHNHREATDAQRTAAAIKGGDGKRLTYRRSIA